MPRRLLAWGNNVTGTLDPSSSEPFIHEPRDVSGGTGCDEILWHGWACTIGRDTRSGTCKIWGADSLVKDQAARISMLEVAANPCQILGVDKPIGFLTDDGKAHDFRGTGSETAWADIAVTETGVAYGWQVGKGLTRYPSYASLLASRGGELISHPLLSPTSRIGLYATETRAFVLSRGILPLLFEVISDKRGKPCSPHLKPIEGLEGLGVTVVVPGSSNRLGIVTDAGQAFVIPTRTGVPEPLDIDEDVRLLGVGSASEVVIGEERLWVRGKNEFGELGLIGENDEAAFMHGPVVDVNQSVAVHTSRWTTILTLET